AHMDAAKDEHTAFLERLECCRNDFSGRCEYDRGIELLRRFTIRASGPRRAQLQREFLVTNVPSGSEHFHVPVSGPLNRHVRRCAEAVKSQASARFDPGEPQRPEPDDSCAEQRRGLFIRESCWNGVHEIFRRNDVFRIAAIGTVAREHRVIAKIFRVCLAIFAGSIRPMKPGNANAVADLEAPCVLPLPLDNTHDLVARNHRRFARRQFSFDHVQVGPAHAAGAHTHEHFTALWLRRRDFPVFQRIRFNRSRRAQQACFHRETSALSLPIDATQSSAFYLGCEIRYTRISRAIGITMFTGIIEHTGTIEALDLKEHGGRVTIHAPTVAPSLEVSKSIAVNGCCLTVVDLHNSRASADLSGETIRKTSFGAKGSEPKNGTRVNLELPLTAGKEFGGHFVLGHVDTIGRVTHLIPVGENWWFGVQVPVEFACYIVQKGSITIDGISLTVARWQNNVAEVSVIPY